MADLLLDDGGKPIPQYKNTAGTAFEAVRGAAGAMDVNVKNTSLATTLEELPAGTNMIGKVQLVDAASVAYKISDTIKAVNFTGPDEDTPIWTPASGKRIVLKGLFVANYSIYVKGSLEEYDYEDGMVVYIMVNGSMQIVNIPVVHRQIILDLDPYNPGQSVLGGDYSKITINFGEGVLLPIDGVLTAYCTTGEITVTAWGYEV